MSKPAIVGYARTYIAETLSAIARELDRYTQATMTPAERGAAQDEAEIIRRIGGAAWMEAVEKREKNREIRASGTGDRVDV